jgi:hypothetical protein
VTIEVPEFQQVVEGRFDGKDYPVMQAGEASKFTNSFAKGGPHSFKIHVTATKEKTNRIDQLRARERLRGSEARTKPV